MRKPLIPLLAVVLCLTLGALASHAAPAPTAPPACVAALAQDSTPGAAVPEALGTAFLSSSQLQMSPLAAAQTLGPIPPFSAAFLPVCSVSCTPCPCSVSQGICAFRCVGR
jgi:hypothetical protein